MRPIIIALLLIVAGCSTTAPPAPAEPEMTLTEAQRVMREEAPRLERMIKTRHELESQPAGGEKDAAMEVLNSGIKRLSELVAKARPIVENGEPVK